MLYGTPGVLFEKNKGEGLSLYDSTRDSKICP